MSELVDPRPVLTLVMGCNGSGKTSWKRENRGLLPTLYIDQDSLAEGMGDWDSEASRAKVRVLVDKEIEKAFARRLEFGMESTFSGVPGPALLDRAVKEDYFIRGYYIGTESHEINARRIEHRVLMRTGHRVDPALLPARWAHSLGNLRKKMRHFDELVVMDNSIESNLDAAEARDVFIVEKGRVTHVCLNEDDCPAWCARIVERLRQSEQQRARAAERARRKEARRRQMEGAGHGGGPP